MKFPLEIRLLIPPSDMVDSRYKESLCSVHDILLSRLLAPSAGF
jgi:hypothetical protein